MKKLILIPALLFGAISFAQNSSITVGSDTSTPPKATTVVNTNGGIDAIIDTGSNANTSNSTNVQMLPKKSNNPYDNVTIKKKKSSNPYDNVKMGKPKTKGTVIDQK